MKRKLPFDELKQLSIRTAKREIKNKPISTAFNNLVEMDSSVDWVSEWIPNIIPSLVNIAKAKSHEAQALQCCIEIMQNVEKQNLMEFILEENRNQIDNFFMDSFFQDTIWTSTENHSKKDYKLYLRRDHFFYLLNDLSIMRIYCKNFMRYQLNIDFFCATCNLIYTMYYNITYNSKYWIDQLENNEHIYIQSKAKLFFEHITSKLYCNVLKLKKDFETEILAGNIFKMEAFKEEALKFGDLYENSYELLSIDIREMETDYLNRNPGFLSKNPE